MSPWVAPCSNHLQGCRNKASVDAESENVESVMSERYPDKDKWGRKRTPYAVRCYGTDIGVGVTEGHGRYTLPTTSTTGKWTILTRCGSARSAERLSRGTM